MKIRKMFAKLLIISLIIVVSCLAQAQKPTFVSQGKINYPLTSAETAMLYAVVDQVI